MSRPTIYKRITRALAASESVERDYVSTNRLGTVCILAALDLHTGTILAQIHDHHNSRKFIELLKELDYFYSKKSTIRVILNNHSVHVSKETIKYFNLVASLPRFCKVVLTNVRPCLAP